MKRIVQTLGFCILIIIKLGSPLNAADADSLVSVSPATVYVNCLRTVMLDHQISDEEKAFLNTLATSLHLSPQVCAGFQTSLISTLPKHLDQSGRWPLILQNIAWGSGLYGWAVPTVLGVQDGKWIIGSEMMSFAGAFYLTHKYTQHMDINHARAQMMRTGSGIGFHMGWSVNTIFNIWDHNENKAALTVLMAAVPAGILGGDYIYRTWEPSNGQAWALTLWGEIGWLTVMQLHNILAPAPDSYELYGDSRDAEAEAWAKGRALTTILSYPLGIWAGHDYFGDRAYSLGDAFMLTSGYGMGMGSALMLGDLVGINVDGDRARALSVLGGLGGVILMDKYIAGYDYSFGQAFLMTLGTGSGILFNMGLGAIMEVNSAKTVEFLVLTGGAAGFVLTRKIIDPAAENSLTAQQSPSVSLYPVLFSSVARSSKSTRPVPGLQCEVRF